MASPKQDNIKDVMVEAMGHLELATVHLRSKGASQAANTMAQAAIAVVEAFNGATANWGAEAFKLESTSSQSRKAHTGHPVLVAKKPKTINEHVEKLETGTWASVAALPTKLGNKLVKHRPEDGQKRTVTEEELQTVCPDYRVVWIKSISGKKPPMNFITNRITEGALFSVGFSESEDMWCVIFHLSEAAQAFVKTNNTLVESEGHPLYGPGYGVALGTPFPWCQELSCMDSPKHERRRLTFARSKLFSEGFEERHFKKDLYEVIGEPNVELVWLFNTGNGESQILIRPGRNADLAATVIFSSVAIARIVKETFMQKSRMRSGPYAGISITYSHDPCEKAVNFVTQMAPRPGDGNPTRAYMPAGRKHSSSSLESEWTTVKRR